jgi:hypothetical protein
MCKVSPNCGNQLQIDNQHSNYASNALLFVTQNVGTGVVLDAHPYGVQYDGSKYWSIVNEDASNIVNGATFNVLVINQ